MLQEHSTRTFTQNQDIILNRFIKISILYTSNYHQILYVYDNFLDRSVVLKKIKKEFISQNSKNLLKEEFKMLSSFRLKNIIRAYEYYIDDNECFYTMEYIKENFIKNNINIYFEQILDTFKYIHEIGILHNDIKNNNFLFTDKNFILIDFSICKKIENLEEIREENQKLIKYMIYLLNYNLDIDFLAKPKSSKKYVSKRVIDNLLNIYTNKNIEII